MYGLGFAGVLVLTMYCDVHIRMGGGHLCMYLGVRSLPVRCNPLTYSRSARSLSWFLRLWMPLMFVISILLCRALLACYISTCGPMSVATLYSSDQWSYACPLFALLCVLGLVLYIFRWVLLIYLCDAFGLLYSTMPCCVEDFLWHLNAPFFETIQFELLDKSI